MAPDAMLFKYILNDVRQLLEIVFESIDSESPLYEDIAKKG